MNARADQEERVGLVAKALAILAVLLLHLIALYPTSLFTTHPLHEFVTVLSQLLRFSVPLFLALSGFGLSRKYFGKKIPVVDFFLRRVGKLLPLYALWSVVIFLSLLALQNWRPVLEVSWWQHFILGSVDYHLYFVFLIFQCYVVFSLLPVFGKKGLLGLLIASGVLQLLWFVGVRQLIFQDFSAFPAKLFPLEYLPERFLQDQLQYRLLVNWLFYFLGGVWLGQQALERVRQSVSAAILVFGACAVGAYWMIADAFFLIEELGVTTYALGFTRPAVMLYASAVAVAVIVYAPPLAGRWTALRSAYSPNKWSLPGATNFRLGPRFSPFALLARIGTHSYLIFLSHTVALRLVAEFMNLPGSQAARFSVVAVSSVALAIGLALSRAIRHY